LPNEGMRGMIREPHKRRVVWTKSMLDDEIVGAPATSDKGVVGGYGRGVVVGNSLELDDEGATRVVGWRGHL